MKNKAEKGECKPMNMNKNANVGGGAVYGLGLIGAVIYYLQQASTVTEGLIGVLKAIVWPAFLIHKVFGILGL